MGGTSRVLSQRSCRCAMKMYPIKKSGCAEHPMHRRTPLVCMHQSGLCDTSGCTSAVLLCPWCSFPFILLHSFGSQPPSVCLLIYFQSLARSHTRIASAWVATPPSVLFTLLPCLVLANLLVNYRNAGDLCSLFITRAGVYCHWEKQTLMK